MCPLLSRKNSCHCAIPGIRFPDRTLFRIFKIRLQPHAFRLDPERFAGRRRRPFLVYPIRKKNPILFLYTNARFLRITLRTLVYHLVISHANAVPELQYCLPGLRHSICYINVIFMGKFRNSRPPPGLKMPGGFERRSHCSPISPPSGSAK
jgi:hypothetical protein